MYRHQNIYKRIHLLFLGFCLSLVLDYDRHGRFGLHLGVRIIREAELRIPRIPLPSILLSLQLAPAVAAWSFFMVHVEFRRKSCSQFPWVLMHLFTLTHNVVWLMMGHFKLDYGHHFWPWLRQSKEEGWSAMQVFYLKQVGYLVWVICAMSEGWVKWFNYIIVEFELVFFFPFGFCKNKWESLMSIAYTKRLW